MDIKPSIFIFSLLLLVSGIVSSQEFYTGVDLSYVNELESCGATYKGEDGVVEDPYKMLASKGAKIVRIRLWHDPTWTNYGNIDDVKVSIARAKTLGMQVMLGFHYSDFWADPGRQWRPAAWESVIGYQALGDSLYNYTFRTLNDLNDENLLPEFLQIGNETNGNILQLRNGADLDEDSPNLNPVYWARQVYLLQSGINAVLDFNQSEDTNLKTIIHLANPSIAANWFSNAISNGLSEFSIIGLSYYPQWHKIGVREVADHVKSLKDRFGKEVMIVETGYPWTNNNSGDEANNVLGDSSRLFAYSDTFSIETQKDFLIELSWLVKERGGLGVIYWEPAWISTTCQTYWGTGSHWENATFFDFDGKIHSGADFLSYDYEVMPETLNNQSVVLDTDDESTYMILYPSLADDKIILHTNLDVEVKDLVNLKGQSFPIFSYQENEYLIDHLEPGVYMFLLRAMASERHSLRFIKK
ncbi:MAG: glycosyl hydrolase 53 family protein [Bacteroidota bacterium]